jgi:anthranilate synthase component 1
VLIRPIAGTRPRGASNAEDARLARELEEDPKEKAEHIMLVDLARNDLGRVCNPGTVEVTRLMQVERYSHVMHLVSEVKGTLRRGMDNYDLLRAAFPAGTVSGAPKVRACEIIEELEPEGRGPYAGAVGYIDYSGDMDTCIAIRTALVTGGMATVQAGAGIVADSIAENEWNEARNKASAVIRAIKAADDRAGGQASAKGVSRGGQGQGTPAR